MFTHAGFVQAIAGAQAVAGVHAVAGFLPLLTTLTRVQ